MPATYTRLGQAAGELRYTREWLARITSRTASLRTSGPHTGSACIEMGAVNGSGFGFAIPRGVHTRAGGYFFVPSTQNLVEDNLFLFFTVAGQQRDTHGVLIDLLNSEITLLVDDAIVDTATFAESGIALDTWLHFGWNFKPSAWLTFFVEGTAVLSYNAAVSLGDVNGIFFGDSYILNTGTIFYIDDFYLDLVTGEVGPSTPPRKIFMPLSVTAPGMFAQWTPSGAAQNYLAIDDPTTPDGDTTHNYSVVESRRDTFNTSDFTVPAGGEGYYWRIAAVIPQAVVKKLDPSENLDFHLLLYDGLNFDVAEASPHLGPDYLVAWARFDTEPDGSSWSEADVNGMEIGYGTSSQAIVEIGGCEPDFQFIDNFTSPEAAPIALPRSSQPGPGRIELNEGVDDVGPIVDDKMVMYRNHVLWVEGAYEERVSAMGTFADITLSPIPDDPFNGSTAIGWDYGSGNYAYLVLTVGVNGGWQPRVQASEYDDVHDPDYFPPYGSFPPFNIDSTETYRVGVIRRGGNNGNLYVIKGGAFTEWTLVYASYYDNSTDAHHAAIENNHGLCTEGHSDFDTWRVVTLCEPFDDHYGLAVNTYLGAQALGSPFTCQPDGAFEFYVTTWPTGTQRLSIRFRMVDANNYLELRITNGPRLNLYKVEDDMPTLLEGPTPPFSNTYRRIYVHFRGDFIAVTTKNFTQLYTEVDWPAETGGQIDPTSTGGAVQDIITWPWELDTPEASALDEVFA